MKQARFLPVILLLVPLVCPVAAQGPLPTMDLHLQSLDGNAEDVVGPEVSDDPDNERVWGLQGRRREVWRVSDRQRFLDEEDTDFATRLGWGAIDLISDPPDPLAHRLFTLTQRQVQQTETGVTIFPATIKVDRIQNPDAPETLQVFTFSDDDRPTFIGTIPEANKLIVLMGFIPDPLDPQDPPLVPSELRIYDYSSGIIPNPQVTPPSVAQIPSGVTECSQGLRNLIHAQVEEIGPAQQRMALISATVHDPECTENIQAAALVVCNIENLANPFFYAVDLTKQTWQPCRPPPPPIQQCDDWRFHGLTHVRTIATMTTPSKDLVYVVGGEDVQLTELDVTNVALPGIGIVENATYTVNSADILFEVAADPEAPGASDYLYIIGRHNAYVVDRANLGIGQYVTQTTAGFGNGPAGDAQFMLADPAGAARREIWSLAMQAVRYVFRVTDFTQDGVGVLDPPDASEGYYSAGPTDGAVANFNWASAYTLTFGGVARWDISGSEPIPAGYQPACDPCMGVGQVDFTTEHLELVDLGQVGSPDWRLIAATPHGGFFEWPLDPITHDPLAGSFNAPLNPETYWPGLNWHVNAYGNDIAITTDLDANKVIVFDYSSKSHKSSALEPVVPRFGIARYNWTQQLWASAITWSDPTAEPNVKNIVPWARDIACDGKWLVVAADGGFFMVDVLTGAVTDYVHTDSLDSPSFRSVNGVDRVANRIFASMGDPVQRFAFRMYDFNTITGLVDDTPLQSLYDGSSGVPDDFPGVFVQGGEKISVIEVKSTAPKKWRLYSGTGNGNLLEIEWQAATGTMTPLSTWNNGGYFDPILDCNVYKTALPLGGSSFGFGPAPAFELRIVVAKMRETFEIVSPPDF